MADSDSFELTSGLNEADIDTICDMTLLGWADNPLWQGAMGNMVRVYRKANNQPRWSCS